MKSDRLGCFNSHRPLSKLALICATSVGLLLASGCSNEEGPTAAAKIDTNPLLKKVTNDTVAFFRWDSAGDGATKYHASPYASSMSDMLNSLEGPGAQGIEIPQEVKDLVKGISDAGFVSTAKGQTEPIAQGLLTVNLLGGDANKPEIAIYFQGASGINFAEKLPKLEETLKKTGANTAKASIGGIDGFQINNPSANNPEASPPIKKFVFIAKGDKMAIASSDDAAQRLFTEVNDGGYEKLRASDAYKKSTNEIEAAAGQIGFAYVDLPRIIQAAAKVSPSGDFNPAKFPLDGLAFSRSFESDLSDKVSIGFTPRDEQQKGWATRLEQAASSGALAQMPSNVVVGLALDGKLLGVIRDVATKEMPPEQLAMAGEVFKLLDTVNAFELGLGQGATGSPFPDVIIQAQSSKAGELAGFIKTQLGTAIKAGALPMAPLQEKDVAGTKVNFSVSPIGGMGLFMANTPDRLLLTSSEKSIEESLKGGAGMRGNLPAEGKKRLEDSKPLVAVYTDFTRVASIVETVQGGLAMFTGGQQQVDQATIAKLKQMGGFLFTADIKNGQIRVQNHYFNQAAVK